MINLQIKRSIKLPVDKSVLIRAAQVTLSQAGVTNQSDLTIAVGNDALLKELNHQFRGVDNTTDVLSFPSGEIDPDTSDVYLGDVVISLPRAEEQARSEGHPVGDELQLLVVHGVLHLLGFDHVKAADKRMMQATQGNILKTLGLHINITL